MIGRNHHSLFALWLLLLLPAWGSAEALRTVALSGEQAPGAPSGVAFAGFEQVAINSSGQVAFRAYSPESTDSGEGTVGVWSEGAGALALVARSGDVAPGGPAEVTYSNIGGPLISSTGAVAFAATVEGRGVTEADNYGVWSEAPGALSLVARTGDQAPGAADGVVFDTFSQLILGGGGHAAFSATQSNGYSGIWSEGHGAVAPVARGGDPVPGMSDGMTFLSVLSHSINSDGHTTFSGVVGGNGVGARDGVVGVWSDRSGTLEAVALPGDPAPGVADGVTFARFANPTPNYPVRSAYQGFLSGDGVNGANNHGIWADHDGALALVARAGDAAPGTESDVHFDDLGLPLANTAGETAFTASVAGAGVDATNDQGIWSGRSGALELVARNGDPAAGVPAGAVFEQFLAFSLNAAGSVAFVGRLTGEGIDSGNDLGIWAQDRAGALRLVARVGESLQVAPGDHRTILSFGALPLGNAYGFFTGTGNDDGRPSSFSDLGQVAFVARFADGTSGVFVSNVATAPEPNAALLLLIGAGAVGPYRARY